MLYLTFTIISSVDLAHYGVSCAKNRVFVDCGTRKYGIAGAILFITNRSQSRPLFETKYTKVASFGNILSKTLLGPVVQN